MHFQTVNFARETEPTIVSICSGFGVMIQMYSPVAVSPVITNDMDLKVELHVRAAVCRQPSCSCSFVCMFPACERDDANWCQGMPGYFCYDPSVQQICCFTCPWMRIGPVGRALFWLNFPSLTFLLQTNFPGFLCKLAQHVLITCYG